MAFSLYEINDAQDIAKPGDLMGENYYLQDVFYQTRPEVFDFNDQSGDKNPFFLEYNQDEKEDKGDYERTEYRNNFNFNNWDREEFYFVSPKKQVRSSVLNVIAQYRLETDPAVISLQQGTNKTAVSMADLMRMTSDFSKHRSPRTNVKLLKADNKNNMYSYNVRGYEGYSDTRGHNVIIQLGKDRKRSILQQDIKVSCTCPFWKYWGPDFNAQSGGYLLGPNKSDKPGQRPDVRDVPRRNKICKHVHSVGQLLIKFSVKHRIDDYKDVDNILKHLKKEKSVFLPDVTIEHIKDLVKRLDRTDRVEIEPLLKNYESEKDDKRRDRIWEDIMEKMKKSLDGEDRNFLVKLFNDAKNWFNHTFRDKKRDEDVDKRDERKKELDERRDDQEKEREEKKQERKEKDQEKKKKRLDKVKRKPTRRQKQLKKFIKKTHLEELDISSKVANIINLYLEETGELHGDL